MRRQVAVVGVVVALVAAQIWAGAQEYSDTQYGEWTYTVRHDDFSGEEIYRAASALGDEVAVFINCVQEGPVLSIFLMDGTFRDGDVAMRWDGGAVESYTFMATGDQSLAAGGWEHGDDYQPEFENILGKLKAHSELRLRVWREPDTAVTDRISLSGSGRAIRALGCP